MTGTVPNDANNIQIETINVRTIKHDSSLDSYFFSADLKMTLPVKINLTPVTHNIQKTDGDNGQFYINLFGL